MNNKSVGAVLTAIASEFIRINDCLFNPQIKKRLISFFEHLEKQGKGLWRYRIGRLSFNF